MSTPHHAIRPSGAADRGSACHRRRGESAGNIQTVDCSTITTKAPMSQQTTIAVASLHAAIDHLLTRVVDRAIADAKPAEVTAEMRATVTQIAVEKMLIDLAAAHPGVVEGSI